MKPLICGLSGLSVTQQEEEFIKSFPPWGIILFGRNCASKRQLSALTDQLRSLCSNTDLPILIDQEGGRVARLRPPVWQNCQPMAYFGDLYSVQPQKAVDELVEAIKIQCHQLQEIGINVNCAPMLDVRTSVSHNIIGDRAFSQDPEIVGLLGRIAMDVMIEHDIVPVIKHLPGHGRACLDSHERLPVITTSREEMLCSDLHPFIELKDAPLAMTAHILYTAFDEEYPATLSETIIKTVIREHIGFSGLLMSDDLCMKALVGQPEYLAKQALQAGCDLILHCSGNLEQMYSIASVLPDMQLSDKIRVA